MRAWGYRREGDWKALSEGDHVVNGHLYRLEVVDCGEVLLPSGRLAVCDPFAGMRRGGNPHVALAPGRYTVRVTLADVPGDEETRCPAYASLVLSPSPETRRELLIPGVSVSSGTACFVDDEALVHGMPPEADWHAEIFENGRSWFARKADPDHLREGLANVPLPLGSGRWNLILFASGWGDGVYPVVGGYDAQGALVAVHVDFGVLPCREERDAVRNWLYKVPFERRRDAPTRA